MPGSPSRVAVIFGGPSPEHDVSILTGLLTCHELVATRAKDTVTGIYWSRTGAFSEIDPTLEAADFLKGSPPSAEALELSTGSGGGFTRRRGRLGSGRERLQFDVAVVCCHGGPGEDGTLQGALDLAGIAYSGPTAMGAALGMDKLATAGILAAAGVSVLPRSLLVPESEPVGYDGPYIVKPRFGGSSIGIDVVKDFETAKLRLSANVHLRRGAVLEPYREDLYDIQVGVRSFPALELSAIERPVRQRSGSEILNYSDKYVGGEGMHTAARELPARISDELETRLRTDARLAAKLLQIRGIARIDFLSDGDALYLNEVNTIPGSLSRHLFISPARSFSELLDDAMNEALSYPAAVFSSTGADGTVLRTAGSISSKLG